MVLLRPDEYLFSLVGFQDAKYAGIFAIAVDENLDWLDRSTGCSLDPIVSFPRSSDALCISLRSAIAVLSSSESLLPVALAEWVDPP